MANNYGELNVGGAGGGSGSSYLHNFTAANWVKGTEVRAASDDPEMDAIYDYTITIPAATHGLQGSSVTANFLHKVGSVYKGGTWATISDYATIASNVITLHHEATEEDAGYEGQVMLFVM